MIRENRLKGGLMLGHWYVVVNQKNVRVFTEVSERNRLKQISSFENPLGGEKRRSLIRKQAGMGMRSLGRGQVRYSETRRKDPVEMASIQFAKTVVKYLAEEKRQKNFESLTIVAEPHFLGKLRAEMGVRLEKSVTEWIKKDLQKTPQKELQNFLLPKKATGSLGVVSSRLR